MPNRPAESGNSGNLCCRDQGEPERIRRPPYGGRQMVVGEYVPARLGRGSTGFQNFLTPRVDSASPAPPQLMPDHVHQNRKQPRPPVCARRELVEDLPGAQACLLDCILGSAGIPQHMQSLAIEAGQIGQSDRLKFSIAVRVKSEAQRDYCGPRSEGLSRIAEELLP